MRQMATPWLLPTPTLGVYCPISQGLGIGEYYLIRDFDPNHNDRQRNIAQKGHMEDSSNIEQWSKPKYQHNTLIREWEGLIEKARFRTVSKMLRRNGMTTSQLGNDNGNRQKTTRQDCFRIFSSLSSFIHPKIIDSKTSQQSKFVYFVWRLPSIYIHKIAWEARAASSFQRWPFLVSWLYSRAPFPKQSISLPTYLRYRYIFPQFPLSKMHNLALSSSASKPSNAANDGLTAGLSIETLNAILEKWVASPLSLHLLVPLSYSWGGLRHGLCWCISW